MKILLRNYGEEQYVWQTAKYNYGDFYVDGEKEPQYNVVSIVNDNRKKYIQCSSCGKVFRRDDPRFKEHKRNAIKPETCFNCPHMSVEDTTYLARKFTTNPDGTFTQTEERSANLTCSCTGLWSYYSINHSRSIEGCKKRQCGKATEVEIVDFFTNHPGVFDDIITIDKILDAGYNVNLPKRHEATYDIICGDLYTIGVVINTIGIVDRFVVWFEGDKHHVYYSKRYNELFCSGANHKYIDWFPMEMFDETREEIKNAIAKLYR